MYCVIFAAYYATFITQMVRLGRWSVARHRPVRLPPPRRDGRAAECEALEKPWDASPRGFESLSLRSSEALSVLLARPLTHGDGHNTAINVAELIWPCWHRGSIRSRGADNWQVRVSLGRDPSTGRYEYVTRWVHGTKRNAQRASATLLAGGRARRPPHPARPTLRHRAARRVDGAHHRARPCPDHHGPLPLCHHRQHQAPHRDGGHQQGRTRRTGPVLWPAGQGRARSAQHPQEPCHLVRSVQPGSQVGMGGRQPGAAGLPTFDTGRGNPSANARRVATTARGVRFFARGSRQPRVRCRHVWGATR